MLLAPASTDASAVSPVIDRLGVEFPEVPPGMVADRVAAAVTAVALFGESVASALPTVERIAREDLVAMRQERAR